MIQHLGPVRFERPEPVGAIPLSDCPNRAVIDAATRIEAGLSRFRLSDDARQFAGLYRAAPLTGYGRLGAEAEAHLQALAARLSPEDFRDLMAQAMLFGIAHFWAGRPELPAEVLREVRRAHDRIERCVAAGGNPAWQVPRDILRKDLAAAFGRAIPVSAWLVTRTRPSRRILAAGGVADRLKAIAFAGPQLLPGGDWLTANFHPAEREHFNRAGFETLARGMAALAAADPSLRGITLGPSWLNDPALARISPRLAWRQAWRARGARTYFQSWEGAESWALKASASRREAYAAGRYRPAKHLLLWPRAAILRWWNGGTPKPAATCLACGDGPIAAYWNGVCPECRGSAL